MRERPAQRLAAAFIEEGRMAAHLATLKPAYRENNQAMQAALAEELGGPGVSWTDQAGGFFLWLTLPAHVDATRASSVAIEEGVAFIPGPAFSVSGRFSNALRLCFASNPGPRTAEGVRRLRRAVERVYGDEWRAPLSGLTVGHGLRGPGVVSDGAELESFLRVGRPGL